ncbi:hypothetical protein M0R72_00985 [Candidatus Pacearchaeota archaeon]|nr:hypothetical protein [Candidatus Pacearchaeota archaeon]
MATTITLSAESKFGYRGQYIARLRGRAAKFEFDRDFIGNKYGKRLDCTTVETDETGLYETCDVGKHGKDKSYYLVLPWNDGIVRLVSDHEDALAIAKRMSAGECIADIVAVERGDVVMVTTYPRICGACGATCDGWTCACGSTDVHQQTVQTAKLKEDGSEVHSLAYVIRGKCEAKKAIAAATIDGAALAIANVLVGLPAAQQKQALAAAKARLFPKAEPQHEIVSEE